MAISGAGVVVSAAGVAVTEAGTATLGRTGNSLSDNIQNFKDSGNNSNHMIGENGTQTSSSTVWQNGNTERIDVENPNPGKRPGQIHYQDENNVKWLYDIENKQFVNPKTHEAAPTKIQKLLKNEEIQKAIKKGLKYLGE